jgi:hypothetical protein
LNNNKNNIYPSIFSKKTNVDSKLIPFNAFVNQVGKTKYLPPVAKEWKNNVYTYNHYNSINLPIHNKNINEIIKGYFSLYFNNKFINTRFHLPKDLRKSLNKILVSKIEVNHTNNKAIITVYVFNKERLTLLKRMTRLNIILESLYKLWSKITEEGNKKNLFQNWMNLAFSNNLEVTEYKQLHAKKLRFQKKIRKILLTIRRLKLKLNLNSIKFEDKFLFKLSQLISKHYGKKVEFNIINLKSLANNTDLFNEVLTLKLRKEQRSPSKAMSALLGKINLPKVNRVIEKARIENQVNYSLVQNIFKVINISNILNDNSKFNDLNKLLYNLYNKEDSIIEEEEYYLKLRNIILDSIKYKVMSGARITVKGRLTPRYRADRALYKYSWKGGLKNIDSAYKGLSTVVFRGYQDINVQKSQSSSKRRIGSFGVTTWISSK